jgi:dimethylamine monooxygenase subunit A
MAAPPTVMASPARLLRRPLPFADGGARHKVGARNVGANDWLELTGEDVAGQLAEKRRLFETRRSDVLGALPGSENACVELLALVREKSGLAGLSGRVATGLHPLEEAGRLVPEDFALHIKDPSSGELILAAGSVCFPNRWLLADKLGRPVTAVHDPVPGYRAELGRPVEQLMDRLPVGRVIERHNWGLAHSPELFRAPGPSPNDLGTISDLATIAERRWLRIERQTLRRLPHSGAVVFTIRTLQAPMAILRGDLEANGLLARAIRELAPEVARYKLGPPQVQDALLQWCESSCG